MQYTVQGWSCDDTERRDLLLDIGTEEISHLEIVGALIRMHLQPMKKALEDAETGSASRRGRWWRPQSLQLDGQPLDGRLSEGLRRA